MAIDLEQEHTIKQQLFIREVTMGVILIVIWCFFALQEDRFLSPRNLSMLAIELAVTATLALGMFLVLLPGMIDLSVGSGVGLTGGIASVLVFHYHWPSPLAMGAGLLFAMAAWFLMGNLIIRQKVPAFIITLGGLLLFKGLFWRVIQNSTVPVTEGNAANYYSLLTTYYFPAWCGYLLGGGVSIALVISSLRSRFQRRRHGFAVDDAEITFYKLFVSIQGILLMVIVMNRFRGIPLSMVILGSVICVVYMVTQHTPFGRYLYAIGGNEEAAVLSGIPVKKVVVGAFTL